MILSPVILVGETLVYAARAVAVLGFLFAPKTTETFLVFAVVI